MSIGSVVNLVAGKIGELLIEEAKLLYGVEDQIRSLQEELMMIQSFLIDMEAMDEEEGDERSRTAIKQIRKIAYDAEDAIESYILEASNSSADKPEDLFRRYICFCTPLSRTHQIGSEIEAIKERIVVTMERWKKYVGEIGIIRSVDARQEAKNRNRLGIRQIAYSHTIEDHVVGLDEDISKLIGVLICDDEDTKNLQVVSFVGMGGSGKTTLARKLYNHENVSKHFDCVAWVSISQHWVLKQILLDLLKKVGGENMTVDESLSLQVLVEKLHGFLEKKRCLIVLDDVWEREVLEDILPALPLGSDGRKVIVTTRNRNVVDFLDVRCFIHEPKRLTDEESWELFGKIALIHREKSDSCLDICVLKPLGEEMLKRCEGLPLAVIALAGILGKKETFEEWEKINMAVSSRIMEDGSGTHLYGPVNKMLALSYYDCPRELKPCFLYLAKFPEDHEIQTGQLIRLWIAEGFIESDKLHEGDTLEDLAQSYLDELICRCVVQIAQRNYQGKVKGIRIHDLVRDLCIKKAKEEDFLEILSSKSPNPDTKTIESRRAAIYSRATRTDVAFPVKNQHLRSLFREGDGTQIINLEVISMNFKLLRVLLLEGVKTSNGNLPTGIGRLIHLRYLGLRKTNIIVLPSSIEKLHNLVTFDYRDIYYASNFGDMRIPDAVWEIQALRHLYLPHVFYDTIKVESLKLHSLKNLQTLSGGSVGGSWILKELPHLSPTVRKLNLQGITSKKQLEAVFECPSIIESGHLHSLDLRWDWEDMSSDNAVKLDSLESIIHSQHLRRLKLRGLAADGIQFPASISKLWLYGSRFEEEAMLKDLGKLPHLIELLLWYDAYVGMNWTCSSGEFPQLKELRVNKLSNLEEWRIERGAMPQLKKLRIGSSEKLRKIPEGLKFITTLQELHMSSKLYKRIIGEDAHSIQHVPLVNLFDTRS